MLSRALRAGALLAISLILSFALAEGILLAFGYRAKQPPQAVISADFQDNWRELDPQLGWVSKPGSHRSWEEGQKLIHIENDRTRRVLGPAKPGAPEFMLLGDSMTLGLGVEDQDTFASLLNEQLVGVKVVNFGTAGYGTYQSLLRLRAELPSRKQLKYVAYGLNHTQADRNVAAGRWVWGLTLPDGTNVVPPHVRLESGHPRELPGSTEPMWPYEKKSALITLVHNLFIRAKYKVSVDTRIEVTKGILREMHELTSALGIAFFVYLMTGDDEDLLKSQIPDNLRWVDCRLPGGYSPEMRIGGGGHPNERAHRHFAGCIAKELARLGEQ